MLERDNGELKNDSDIEKSLLEIFDEDKLAPIFFEYLDRFDPEAFNQKSYRQQVSDSLLAYDMLNETRYRRPESVLGRVTGRLFEYMAYCDLASSAKYDSIFHPAETQEIFEKSYQQIGANIQKKSLPHSVDFINQYSIPEDGGYRPLYLPDFMLIEGGNLVVFECKTNLLSAANSYQSTLIKEWQKDINNDQPRNLKQVLAGNVTIALGANTSVDSITSYFITTNKGKKDEYIKNHLSYDREVITSILSPMDLAQIREDLLNKYLASKQNSTPSSHSE